MIRQIAKDEYPVQRNNKFNKFAEDIESIIRNKIEFAEILDMPYAASTSVQDLAYKARQICRNYYWETFGKAPEKTDFFKFSKKRTDNGLEWYVRFNVSDWERMTNAI